MALASSYSPEAPPLRHRAMIGAERWRLTSKVAELWQYRELFYFFVWRDVKVRYAQSVMGIGWATIQPLVPMILFTIIFGELVPKSLALSRPERWAMVLSRPIDFLARILGPVIAILTGITRRHVKYLIAGASSSARVLCPNFASNVVQPSTAPGTVTE